MIEDERHANNHNVLLPISTNQMTHHHHAVDEQQEQVEICRSIEGINNAVSQPTRMKTLSSMHNLLIVSTAKKGIISRWLKAGAANALCLKLGYALAVGQEQISEEINRICSMLSILYSSTGSEVDLQLSIQQIGMELLPLLFRIVLIAQQQQQQCCCWNNENHELFVDKRYWDNHTSFTQQQRHHMVALSALSSIFFIAKATTSNTLIKNLIFEMVVLRSSQPQQHCFLDFILNDIFSFSYSDRFSRCTSSTTLSLGIIKCMTFRCSCIHLKVNLARHERLMDALIQAMKLHVTNTKTAATLILDINNNNMKRVLRKNAEYASAAIWNIVFHRTDDTYNNNDDEKMLLLLKELQLELAANDNLITTLSLLLQGNNNSAEDNDAEVQLIKIRRNAISILGTLSSLEENKFRLVSSCSNVLESLLFATRNDLDTDVRRRAIRTIRYLVGNSQSATHIATIRSESMNCLIQLAIASDDSTTKNQAIGAFSSLSSNIRMNSVEEHVQRSIASSAIQLMMYSNNNNDNNKYIDLQLLTLLHLSDIPKNCIWMMNDGSLLDILHFVFTTNTANSITEKCSEAIVKNAIKTLYNLSGERLNLKKIGSCKRILQSLATLASSSSSSSSCTTTRTVSIQTIVRLTEDESNITSMAENHNILTALVHFALDSPDDSLLKKKVKESLLKLVPDV